MKRAQWGAIDTVFETYGEHAAQNGKTYDLVDYLLFLSCKTEENPEMMNPGLFSKLA